MDTAARANYRMGMLSHEQGKWQDAMFYLRRCVLAGSIVAFSSPHNVALIMDAHPRLHFHTPRFIDLCNSGAVSSVGKAAEGVANTTYAQCLQVRLGPHPAGSCRAWQRPERQ
jgi:hypothetical protein